MFLSDLSAFDTLHQMEDLNYLDSELKHSPVSLPASITSLSHSPFPVVNILYCSRGQSLICLSSLYSLIPYLLHIS